VLSTFDVITQCNRTSRFIMLLPRSLQLLARQRLRSEAPSIKQHRRHGTEALLRFVDVLFIGVAISRQLAFSFHDSRGRPLKDVCDCILPRNLHLLVVDSLELDITVVCISKAVFFKKDQNRG
jgi:hypothetical protein